MNNLIISKTINVFIFSTNREILCILLCNDFCLSNVSKCKHVLFVICLKRGNVFVYYGQTILKSRIMILFVLNYSNVSHANLNYNQLINSLPDFWNATDCLNNNSDQIVSFNCS